MPLSDLDSKAAINLVPFIMMTWGATQENVVRYCRWDEDVTDGDGNVWSSAPELDVQNGVTFQGGAADTPYSFIIRLARSPMTPLTNPPFQEVTVYLLEGDPEEVGTLRAVHAGFITKTTTNAKGYSKLVNVQVSGWRERINYALGIMCNNSCSWTFADYPSPGNCGIDPTSLVQTATIASITGQIISVPTGLTPTGGGTPGTYWQFGHVEIDGLRISIMQGAPENFQLIVPPPASWAGLTGTFMPGCDKKYSTGCKFWNNQQQFGGLGLMMMAYNPQIESPT